MVAAVLRKENRFKWFPIMLMVSVFQAVSSASIVFRDGVLQPKLLYAFLGLIAYEWLFIITDIKIFKSSKIELEVIGFFLSGISMVISGSIYSDYAVKQLISIIIGSLIFCIMLWFMRSTDRAMKFRLPVAFMAVGLLALNLIMARAVNGALNWINIGSFSIQPSEIVKVAFIFVGAATLEKLQTTRSITRYVIFSIGCIGALFLMKDFGTALIFFVTFIIIAFMRSGDLRTIAMVCTGALLGAMLIIYFKPYVANRFATYRHVWEYINEKGFQQTRVLIYSSSGGLFGLGIGKGRLREVYAASTDLVFGILCEEWGLILAITVILIFTVLGFFAIKNARKARSTFYSIAAAAAAGLFIFQLSLNVFGVTDLLPLTGVTLPFISRGGSSMLCSWALLSFIRSVGMGGGGTDE
ncbi:MAG: FtsW/RodA/SpoVE family cell cycle protein [Clostridiales bacterium]|nr:FtsW/RodA/SpoVE family cell cycle protein [Clostridiales bacterium]